MTDLSKEQLRKIALARRDALPVAFRIEASLALLDLWQEDVRGKVIAGFHPIRSEIDPRPLMMMLKRMGVRLALPVPSEPVMVFRELLPDSQLVSAGFGTLAPPDTAPELTPDILLMPMAGFDNQGNRLGYGKGHYDKYLEKHRPLKIGVAFSAQEFDKIPADVHDVRLDYVLTEKELRRCGKL